MPGFRVLTLAQKQTGGLAEGLLQVRVSDLVALAVDPFPGRFESTWMLAASIGLSRIKEMAAEQGMPYQTLINVLVHKYVTNQMYEKDEVLKTLRVAKEAGEI